MSEALYDDYERERYVTRAEVMYELNNPLNHGHYPIDMVAEHSGRSLLREVLEGDLSEWTDDILDAFAVPKTEWSSRLIDPRTGQRIAPEKAAWIRGDLGEMLRLFTHDYLAAGAEDGYNIGRALFTLELDDHVQVDLSGAGEIWVDPGHVSSELVFRANFRKVTTAGLRDSRRSSQR